ncbi:MAG: hypothetical protein JWP11_1530 [Frankiales bacterium]|nr:hypothetical protein [Frankiales bacterium]
MSHIEADPGALAATARALDDATAVAREVHRGSRSLSDAAEAGGSARLAAALSDFRHTWSYGLGLVVDDASTLARMLGQAAAAYEGTDRAIGQACRP